MIAVVPTIDVEGVHGTRPFEQFVLGEVGDQRSWGVYRIAEVLREHGASGTFFVDCYEHTLWGEERLAAVCQRLAALDQDVQLHTHPSWRDDIHDFDWLRRLKRERSFLPQDRDLMAKLGGDEQAEVLEHGARLIESWTGARPVAHRSGGYSINQDTVRALARVGIELDSSMNSAHPNSRLTWSANRVVERDGVIELPVTVLDYAFELPLPGGGRRLYSKTMKTDLDDCSADDFLRYVDEGERLGLRVLNVFMHSYSLLRFDSFYRRIEPDPADLHKLDGLFGALRRRGGVRFLSCKEFLSAYRRDPAAFSGPDARPVVRANARIIGWAARKARHAVEDLCCGVLRRASTCPSRS